VTSPDVRHLPIPPEYVIGEQVRLKSSMALLGRSFRGMFEADLSAVELIHSVQAIRHCITDWQVASSEALQENHQRLVASVEAFRAGQVDPLAESQKR
jgi:hypothetical protein